jgi:hypothetical protein
MAAGFGGNDAAELRPHTAGFNMSSTPMAQKCLRRFVSLAWKDCLKDLDAPYRSGLSKNWIKVKNPKSPTAIGLSMGPITPSPNLAPCYALNSLANAAAMALIPA